MSVVPATWEAESGELLEPGRDYSELRLHLCTPAWVTERRRRKKKQEGGGGGGGGGGGRGGGGEGGERKE